MGTTLTGTTPQDTYDSLIKVTDNGPLSATAKRLSDGLGNDSALALSTSRVGINQSNPTVARLEIVESTNAEALRVDGSGSGFAFVVNGGTSYKSAIRNASVGSSYFSTAAPSNGLIVEGNVGIGTSSPESKLHIADGVSGGTVSLFVDNNINALNSTAQIKFTVDAGGSLTSGGAAIQAVNTDPNYANTDLVFRNSHISSGSLVEVFRLTDGARYLRMASGTGGIQFGGDTAAANALDDYEEGTWTPNILFGGGSTGVTYGGSNAGNYTKIGRKVSVNAYLDISNKGTSTGAAQISNLPFTIAGGASNYGSPSFRPVGISFADMFIGYGDVNDTKISLQECTNAGSVTVLTDSDFSTSTNIIFSFTYFTA